MGQLHLLLRSKFYILCGTVIFAFIAAVFLPAAAAAVKAVLSVLLLPIGLLTFSIIRDIRRHEKSEEELRRRIADVEHARDKIERQTLELTAQAEQIVEARDQARKEAAAKGIFLATMSHEIRTPLSGILGTIELMLDTGLNRSQRELGDSIRAAAESLLNIINDILDFSKIEAGRLELNEAPMALSEVIDEAGMVIQPLIRKKGLRYSVAVLDSSIPKAVKGDAKRLKQILLNLLSNAVKFTPSGGAVTLGVHQIEEDGSGRKKLRFKVQDSGIGIPKDQLGNLFIPFSQLDNNPSGAAEGTGLGLSISNKLLELMGGEFAVKSEAGCGAAFSFELWMEEVKPPRKLTLVTKAPPKLNRLRILVAEDNLINMKIIRTMLTKAGHEVFPAGNGREALELYNRHEVDLVLMDIQMPELDGVAATRQIREKEEETGAHLPIIAVTAHAMKGDRERYLAAGMDDYVSKPIDRSTLFEAIARQISDSTSFKQSELQAF